MEYFIIKKNCITKVFNTGDIFEDPEGLTIITQHKKSFPFLRSFVRMTGIEPARREALDPKSSMSTSSTTSAL